MKIQRGVLVRILLVLMLTVILLYSHGCNCGGGSSGGDKGDDKGDGGEGPGEGPGPIINPLCDRYGGSFCSNECEPDDLDCIQYVLSLNEPDLLATKVTIGTEITYDYSYSVRPAVQSQVSVYFKNGDLQHTLEEAPVEGQQTFSGSESGEVLEEDFTHLCALIEPVDANLPRLPEYCEEIESFVGPQLREIPDTFELTEGEEFTYTVVADDPDCVTTCSLVYSILDSTGLFSTINSASGRVSVRPTQEDFNNAPFDITIRVTDGQHEDTKDVQVTIAGVNDAPEIESFEVSIPESQASYVLNDLDTYITDVDDDFSDLVITFPATTSVATITRSGPIMTFIPTTVGSTDAAITVSDGESSTAGSVRIRVFNTPDDPYFAKSIPDIVLQEDFGEHFIDLSQFGADPDVGDVLTYVVTGGAPPLASAAVIDGNQLKLESAENLDGTGTLTVTVSDGTRQATETVALTVEGVNDPPVFKSTMPSVIDLNEQDSHTLNLLDHVEDDTASGEQFKFNVIPLTPGFNDDLNIVLTGGSLGVSLKDKVNPVLHEFMVVVADGIGTSALSSSTMLSVRSQGEE